jgi:hypothetical protein
MGGCTIWDNVIYLCGGYNRNLIQTWSHFYGGTIDAGNPDSITWTQLEPLPDLTGNCGATAMDGNIYLLGGFIEDQRVASDQFVVLVVTLAIVIQLISFVVPITRNHMVTARQGHNEIYGVAGDAHGDWVTPNNTYYKNHNPMGIEEYSDAENRNNLLSIHPSIGNKLFTISYSLPSPGLVSISLHNVLGQKVLSIYDGEITQGNQSLIISSQDLVPGIYFINLRTGTTNVTQKFVITR